MSDTPLGFDGVLATVPADGMVLEFGVARGASLKQICDIVYPRKVYGFDWFYGIPEPWAIYPRGHCSTGGALPSVRSNAELVVGLVQNTLDGFLASHPGPVAFAHFDMDLYSATSFALTRLKDRFRAGSILLFDEYPQEIDVEQHERRAFEEFLSDTGFGAEFIGKRQWHAYAFRLSDGGRHLNRKGRTDGRRTYQAA